MDVIIIILNICNVLKWVESIINHTEIKNIDEKMHVVHVQY